MGAGAGSFVANETQETRKRLFGVRVCSALGLVSVTPKKSKRIYKDKQVALVEEAWIYLL
jgi:hypothetical protein